MLFDFLQQTLYSGVFFLGIIGAGFVYLRLLKYVSGNAALDTAIAYFLSLCLYTLFCVAALFIFPEKRLALVLVSLTYGLFSFCSIAFFFRKQFKFLLSDWRQRVTLFSAGMLAVFLLAFLSFFLEVYHTSILDEWLHRPIVKSFMENGVFPLVNPLDPSADFIHTYHYGTQVTSAAIGLLFHQNASTALDIFKLSACAATLLLFYGLIFFWTQRRWLSLAGMFLVFFCGSSFFFLDSFTASHLMNFKDWMGLPKGWNWPINVPLSYSLTGITWVNVPLAIALAFFLERIFIFDKKAKKLIILTTLLSLTFVGYFLITELFAAITITGFILLLGSNLFIRRQLSWKTALSATLLIISIGIGIHFTGGLIGDRIDQLVFGKALKATSQIVDDDINVDDTAPLQDSATGTGLFTLRPLTEWGYPSENRTLIIWKGPFYYLRTLSLELLLVGALIYLYLKKKKTFFEHPLLFFLIAIGVIGPLAFTTVFGNLNFAKTAALAFVLLHLFGFYILSRMESPQIMTYILLGLLAFGSITGFLMGPNIQWQWISGKGRSQYCSQNPLCYSQSENNFFERLNNEYPGLKRIILGKDVDTKKVVDLTNSYIYKSLRDLQQFTGSSKDAFIILRAEDTEMSNITDTAIIENGKYRVFLLR